LSVWVLVVTIVSPGRPPLTHQVQSFATQETCATFQQQLATAWAKAQHLVGAGLSEPQRQVLQRRQKTYHCEERM
jgi:hypothetical protein